MSDLLRAKAHEAARDEAIREFLKARPAFLREDPELMQAMGVVADADNVVHFGAEALSRAAKAHKRESTHRQNLETLARANFKAQAQTHEAVIELIGAKTHADLAWRLDALAKARFGLTAAVIAVEGPERAPAGWWPLAEGQCEMTLGRRRAARLGVVPVAHGLFGDLAGEIGSVALIRLSIWEPARPGILAFGAAAEDAFAPEMGHELLGFMARVVERIAERWPVPE